MSTGFEGQVETHKHTFAVADIGDFDLDEDRSIAPSIKSALKDHNIEADVDVCEWNAGMAEIYTNSSEADVLKALENENIIDARETILPIKGHRIA